MAVTLTLPSIKGSRLDHPEMEKNLTDLRDDLAIAKLEVDETTVTPYALGVKNVIIMDATAGVKQIDLPDASTQPDRVVIVQKHDESQNFVNIVPFAGDSIGQQATYTLKNAEETIMFISNGIDNWDVLFHHDKHPSVFGTKLTTTTVANTVAETLLYSYTFPANTFATIGQVTSVVSGSYSASNNNSDFNIIVKMNGVVVHTLPRVGTGTTNKGWKLEVEGTIRSVGASGTYVDIASLHDGDSAVTEAFATELPINTTVPLVYEVYVQWGLADVDNTLSCTQGNLTVNAHI